MKNFLKDLLWLITLGLASGIAYLLPMLLFVWMYSWSHWVIVTFMVFALPTFIGILARLTGLVGGIPFRTIAGLVLACINIIYILVFSIHAVWTSLLYSNGWELSINIFATICYALMFLFALVLLIFKFLEYKNGY